MTQEQGTLEAPQLNVFYMRLTADQVDARLGKMKRGQVIAVPRDMAERYLMAGIAEQVSSGEYEQQIAQKQEGITARQQAFTSLNQAHALWDVSTHRDVLTASEDGLRAAYDAGMPLVNLEHLKDEHGLPLTQDADIEQIIEARNLLHPNAQFPFQAHDRSSVMGGGSPFSVQGGPQPLNPKYREYAEQIAQQEAFANQPQALAREMDANRSPDRPPPGRAGRAARRIGGHQPPAEGGQPDQSPPPPPPAGEQIGNG
jgi:hypothetical protein